MNQTRDDPLERLRRLVARLRGPDGCPWDREQSLAELRAYLLEEAHEAAAAIDGDDPEGLASELGDLLFMTVFAAELLRDSGGAGIDRIAAASEAKMIARHPHVFGDAKAASAGEVRRLWGRNKLEERATDGSLLDGVPASLPHLLQSYRMAQKAAEIGFDWPRAADVADKIAEELAEVRAEMAGDGDDRRQRLFEELGDLLFTVANLARHLEIDPDAALAAANRRFRRRFRRVEAELAQRAGGGEASLEELDALWRRAKSTD